MVGRRAHPEYKDSEIKWLGEIPDNWRTSRAKFCSRINMGQSPSSEYCNLEGIGLPFLQGNAEFGLVSPMPRQYCEVARKVARKGDLLISVRAPVGALNVADQDYGIGRGLCGITTDDSHLKSSFCWYLLHYVRTQLNFHATGSTYDAVSADDVGNIIFLIPPLPEQRAIASFLDRETVQIDALIEKKERQIELLKEKRSALISHVATKGLNPDAPMKDSGIEWIGEIPEHWEVKRLKYLVEGGLVNGLFKKKEFFGYGIKLVNVFDVYRKDFILNQESLDRVEADEAEQKKYAVQSGDIFFVRSSLKLEGVGRSVCALDIKEPTVFECHIVRARPVKRMISPNFLIHFLNSIIANNRFISLANLVTMATIDQEKIKSLEVPLPPRDEQEEIMAVLNWEIESMERLENIITKSITKYCEYRTALISAAVTGKIDIREEVA